MNWIRAHRRAGSRLALLALLLQVVLSFGHAHRLADPAAPASAPVVATADSHRAPLDQPTPSPADDDGDGCAICATLAMAHSGLAAVEPALPLPSMAPSVERTADHARQATARAAPAFQPRAPPAA